MSTTPLPPSIPPTHPAVSTPAARAPLKLLSRPTVAPGPGQVLIHVLWTSSSPLDLHQADGGLLVAPPGLMGGSFAGTVALVGPDQPPNLPALREGDSVFGFTPFRDPAEAAHQTYLTTDAYVVSPLPAGVSLPQAAGVSANLATAFNALTADFGLSLPWPVPEDGAGGAETEAPVVIWGAASSVGIYTVQVLRHWGFRNVVAVARAKHHDYLRELGAGASFDYTEPDVVEKVLAYVGEAKADGAPRVPYVLDCIGSVEGTLRKIARVAEKGTKVAVMLPVIVRHADEEVAPEYEMDVSKVLVGEWKEGVEVKGTRTHHYMHNEFFRDHLQPEIIPALLEQGVVQPNKVRIVEGKTLLERAENARQLLRSQAVSGEKLVWRVEDE